MFSHLIVCAGNNIRPIAGRLYGIGASPCNYDGKMCSYFIVHTSNNGRHSAGRSYGIEASSIRNSIGSLYHVGVAGHDVIGSGDSMPYSHDKVVVACNFLVAPEMCARVIPGVVPHDNVARA